MITKTKHRGPYTVEVWHGSWENDGFAPAPHHWDNVREAILYATREVQRGRPWRVVGVVREGNRGRCMEIPRVIYSTEGGTV